MKKLLVLGTGSNIDNLEVVQYAKTQGIHTIVTDYNPPEKSPAKLIADEYWMISTADIDALEKKCREENVSGIYGGTDYAQDVVLELTERLGLPCYCSKETWHYSRDKLAFKKKCEEYGVPTAKRFHVSNPIKEEELDAIEFPVVVKPTDRSGNLGFSYCYDKKGFAAAYAKALEMSESGAVVVEKLLTGHEYAAFYVLADGEIRLLNLWAMLSQYGMPRNCYSLSTTVIDCLDKYLKEINPQVMNLFKGIGCRDGVAWIEFMTDANGNFYALEVGQRLSGEMLWIPLHAVRNFDSVAWMVNYAVNGYNDVTQLPDTQKEYLKKCACGYILWSKEAGIVTEVTGDDVIKATPGMSIHSVVGKGEYTDRYRYCSIVTFAAEDCEDMCEKIAYVNKTLRMVNEHGNDMLIYYDHYNHLRDVYRRGR